jgi:hypothetical protein
MEARITRLVCVLAAVIALLLLVTSGAGLRGGDVLALAFALSPYPVLAVLAGAQRGSLFVSRLLLTITVVLAVGGTCLLAVDSYRYHTIPEHRMVQRMTPLVVPMLQWVVVAPLGLGFLVKRAVSASGKEE